MDNKAFYGTIIHSISYEKLEIIENCCLVVDGFGTIVKIQQVQQKDFHIYTKSLGILPANLFVLDSSEFIIPGFIDCHTHAPQATNLGIGLTKPLLEWLNDYTFKAEKLYEDTTIAKQIYTNFVKSLIRCGTTTCCYFSSIHLESSKILAGIVHDLHQRAFVGKVNLTNNAPTDYCESSDQSLRDTIEFIKYVEQVLKDSLVKPVITPRFAMGCNLELLKRLSEVAKERHLLIQTHLSENREEIKQTLKMYEPIETYTHIYEETNLLTKKTVLAHCVHLCDEEVEIIKEHRSGIAHCPNSNIMLMSGILDTKSLINKYKDQLKIGLGTDVSGGTSLSILDAIRMAIMSSKAISTTKESNNPNNILTLKEAFYMATMGGAKVLNIDKTVGNFEVGKEFDALVVSQDPYTCFDNTAIRPEFLFESFIINGNENRIKKVYVKGKSIYDRTQG